LSVERLEERMLNQEVCRACKERVPDLMGGRPFGWREIETSRWENDGLLNCPCAAMMIDVKGNPPKSCPFTTEQVMSQS
jgi:hypothetical protein